MLDNQKKKVIPAFSEQCFLVDFVDIIAGWKGTSLPQNYNNIILADPKSASSGLFLNKMLSIANAQEFLDDLPRVVASDLKPNVELFKVVGDKEYRLPLSVARDTLAFSETQQDAVSLRSFSWDYLGTQPAEVDYFINCNMVMHFASAEAFFHEFEAKDGQAYSFRDLIVRRRTSKKDENIKVSTGDHLEYDPKAFRIKVKIGYHADIAALEEKFGGDHARAQKFADFLEASKMELFLSLLKHTFTPQMKHVTETAFDLSIDYNGAVEGAFLMPKSNILVPPLSTEESQEIDKGKKAVEKLDVALLAGGGLTQEQADIAMNSTLADIDPPSWSGQLSSVEDLLGDSEPDGKDMSTEKLRKVLKYFKDKAKIAQEVENRVGAQQKQIDAYGRIISDLYKRGKIYHLNVRNDDLLKWFSARTGFEQKSPASIKILEKKVNSACNDSKPPIPSPPGDPRSKACATAKAELEEYYGKKSEYGLALRSLDEFLQSATTSAAKEDTQKRQQKIKEVQEKEKQEERDEAADSYKKELIDMEGPLEDSGTRSIMFFYYGDLLEVVIDFLQTYKKQLGLDIWNKGGNPDGAVKFLLGNLEYNHPKTNAPRTVNLAKVPISLELWDQWWLDRVIRPQREKYLFKAFLRDSLSTLVKNAFTNRCRIRGQVTNQIRVNIDHVPIKKSQLRISSKSGVSYLTEAVQSIKQTTDAPSGEIVFIYAPSNKPGYLRGDKNEDSKKGIYHISAVGGENKPIKSIDFTKTDQPFFLEAKAEKAGILTDDIQMSEPYNCSFAAFGHTVWRPGKYVYMYFPLSWFSKNQAKMLGLGGYYLMTKTSNVIQRTGKRYTWDSQMECKWETFAKETPKPVSDSLSKVEAP